MQELSDFFYGRFRNIFSFEIGDGSGLVFTKLDFWLFFIVAMAIFSFLHKHKVVRSIYLTAISIFVYFKMSGLFVVILAVSIVANYLLGRAIFSAQTNLRRKWIIAFSAIFNLLILGYFKYALFFTESFNSTFGTDYHVINQFIHVGTNWFGDDAFAHVSATAVSTLILPIGVSFFTFQNIS